MFGIFRARITHPLFPNLPAGPASSARGWSQALAGTFRELAGAVTRGARARRAIYVMLTEAELLTDGERDELWRLFQVPVYALQVDGSGRVIAWECEAQRGLHGPQGEGGMLCACGRPGLRARNAGTLAHAAD
jgi:hypothetical protein